MDRAMVLAAGFGTRLRPLTEELPKPLVPIGDRSLLAHVAASLSAAGVRRLVVNAHHLADAVERAATRLPIPTEVVRERSILGTAGGVANARAALGDGPLLVVNGDILAELDAAGLRRAHDERGHPFATLAVASAGKPPGSGTVGLGPDGEVVRLRGRRFGVETSGADFTGAQILSESALAALPEHGCLVGDLYLPALERGARLVAAPAVERWWDCGTLESYLAVNLAWLGDRDRTAHVGDGASVARRVHLDRAVVGAGATVVGDGELRACVVWPGARATAPLSNAVVTPLQTVASSQPLY